MRGKVFLVGAGPGDPELLTVKAHRLIRTADVVLHDDLISRRLLELIPPTAHIRSVGKRCGNKSVTQPEINSLPIAFAFSGLQVVRLKSGDPLIFGRGGEEIEALRKAKVEVEVVPGVTAAVAAAAAAGISLTHREKASAVLFLSSHTKSHRKTDLSAFASSRTTLVIYMPGYDYAETARQLMQGGLEGGTACAVVSRASCSDERIHRTTVARLPGAPRLPAPTLLLVGDVVDRWAAASAETVEELQECARPIRVVEPISAGVVCSTGGAHWGE